MSPEFNLGLDNYRLVSTEINYLSTGRDRVFTWVGTKHGATAVIYYPSGKKIPLFLLERTSSFHRPDYEIALTVNGFRRLSMDEWVKPGTGGATFSEHGNERTNIGPNFTTQSAATVFLFFWFETSDDLQADR